MIDSGGFFLYFFFTSNSVSISCYSDRRIWSLDPLGTCVCWSFCLLGYHPPLHFPTVSFIYNPKAPPKIKILCCFWPLFSLTQVTCVGTTNLYPQICLLRMQKSETHSHMFIYCLMIWQMWCFLFRVVGEFWVCPSNVKDFLLCIFSVMRVSNS